MQIESLTFLSGLDAEQRDLLRAECGVPGASLELEEDRRTVLRLPAARPRTFSVVLHERSTAPLLRFTAGVARTGWAEGGTPVRLLVRTYLAARREAEPEDDPIRRYVERVFGQYLTCGILAYGFARCRCPACGYEFLAALVDPDHPSSVTSGRPPAPLATRNERQGPSAQIVRKPGRVEADSKPVAAHLMHSG